MRETILPDIIHPRAAYHILSTGEAKNVSTTFYQDNVIINSYGTLRSTPSLPSFLPLSDHNIVSAPVKLLGHFARNRRLGVSAKPPVDCGRLVTDPQLGQEVASAVGSHLRANPPGDSNVDDVKAAFVTVIMRTAELVIPPQERRRAERGWSGDAQTEAELHTATDTMHAAWQRLETNTSDAQLRRASGKHVTG